MQRFYKFVPRVQDTNRPSSEVTSSAQLLGTIVRTWHFWQLVKKAFQHFIKIMLIPAIWILVLLNSSTLVIENDAYRLREPANIDFVIKTNLLSWYPTWYSKLTFLSLISERLSFFAQSYFWKLIQLFDFKLYLEGWQWSMCSFTKWNDTLENKSSQPYNTPTNNLIILNWQRVKVFSLPKQPWLQNGRQ